MKTDPKLRLVMKDFPVLGPDSVEEASRVALAVKNQIQGDKLFDYHVRVMESRGRVNGERAMAVAKEMGLDLARLQKDVEAADIRNALQENVGLGDKLGLSGTPAFIIGEEVIAGAVGIDPLSQAVASVRQCGKAVWLGYVTRGKGHHPRASGARPEDHRPKRRHCLHAILKIRCAPFQDDAARGCGHGADVRPFPLARPSFKRAAPAPLRAAPFGAQSWRRSPSTSSTDPISTCSAVGNPPSTGA